MTIGLRTRYSLLVFKVTSLVWYFARVEGIKSFSVKSLLGHKQLINLYVKNNRKMERRALRSCNSCLKICFKRILD